MVEDKKKNIEENKVEETKEVVDTPVTETKVDEIKEKKVEVKPKRTVKKVSKSEEAKAELEREYNVPLRKYILTVPRYKRAKKAVRVLKEFMVRHMQVRDRDLSKVKVDINLNNEIWFRGIKKPAKSIRVKAKKVDGIVYVELAEVPEVVGYKIARLEKRKAAVQAKTPSKEKKAKEDDANHDGIDDKVEEKEDAKSEAIKDAKLNKEAEKAAKHTTKGAHKNTKPVMKQPSK